MKHILVFLLVIYSSLSFAKDYNFVVKSGDNLGKYFEKAKLSQSVLMRLIASSEKAKKLNTLKIGKKLTITTQNNTFKGLVYNYTNNYDLVVNAYFKNGIKFVTKFVAKSENPLTKYKKYQFKITKNLSYDGNKVGLSFSQLQKITIEFNKHLSARNLHKNDVFKVFFSGEKLLAFQFFGKKTLRLFSWKSHFYNENGKITYPMFLSAPLTYKYISSGFTYKRFHPILKKYLPHRAIDYAANKGTKVFATADGIVAEKHYHRALGNMVKIKHKYGYSTVYAHLSKFANTRVGKKVLKGQVIGYVGSTGRSTGNHLHYELRHGKKYLNPLKYNPKLSYQLKGVELQEFKEYSRQFK